MRSATNGSFVAATPRSPAVRAVKKRMTPRSHFWPLFEGPILGPHTRSTIRLHSANTYSSKRRSQFRDRKTGPYMGSPMSYFSFPPRHNAPPHTPTTLNLRTRPRPHLRPPMYHEGARISNCPHPLRSALYLPSHASRPNTVSRLAAPPSNERRPSCKAHSRTPRPRLRTP